MDDRLQLPDALGEEAFQGPLGEFVRLIEPSTEADPVALLLGSLVAFGNLTGRSAWYPVGVGGRQRTNLFALIVGGTSSGRKGTAWTEVEHLFRQVDDEWSRERIRSGLSSGESLVNAVRNASEPDEEDDDFEPAPTDKRLLVRESEFARVLEVGRRTGNTLSSDLRNLWDSGRAGAMTRKNALTTTDAHVSLVADITPEELRAKLDSVDLVNGLLNRFIPVIVHRTKTLPYQDEIPAPDLERSVKTIRAAARKASSVGRMRDAEATRPIWTETYSRLSEDRPGPIGRLAARGSDHVRRMAMIYALADSSDVIRPEHLRAAEAVWRYADDSASCIFGTPAALDDRLFRAILESGPTGIYRSDLRERIGQSRIRAEELDHAVDRLRTLGKVTEQQLMNGRPGRNPTLLVATENYEEIPV